MSRPWRIAESLKKLREQVNTKYPDRDKTSDGAIGDALHATRKSDHNPWVIDSKGVGVVTAIDIDEDLSAAIHSLSGIIDAICASKDPRVKYIIYEGRITVGGTDLQSWKKYTGPNSHSHHAHISVVALERLYDDRSEWAIDFESLAALQNPRQTLGNLVVNQIDLADVKLVVNAAVAPVPSLSNDTAYYIVAPGDNLSRLARRFTTSVPELVRLNGLKDEDVLQVGFKLRVR